MYYSVLYDNYVNCFINFSIKNKSTFFEKNETKNNPEKLQDSRQWLSRI